MAQALTKAPPPRRRAGPPPIPRAGPTTTAPAAAPCVESTLTPRIPKAETPSDPGFNCALYSAKAFGIATAFVTMGAFVGVWAIQTSLGVQNVRDMFLG